jgi:FkbM family methyltransferase
MLEQNVTSNHLDQVKIERCGLAAEAGKARLYKHPHGASSATLGHAPGAEPEFFEIPLDTLDAVLDRHGIESVDLIKMDVEGAEELILRGATRLFERSRPKVLFEINPEAIPNLGLALDGAWAFLAARGYRFFELNPAGQQTPLHVAPAGGGNIVALPPENSEAK